MIKTAFIVLTTLTVYYTAVAAPDEFPSRFKLAPQPQEIQLLDGAGLLYTELRGVYIKDIDQRPVMRGLLAGLPYAERDAPGSVSLLIRDDLDLPSPEGYILEVRNKKAVVEASDPRGLFYGVQTLTQLLEDAEELQREIPACRIVDYPDIAYRAVHLDLKRHLDAGHYYYAMIDRLAGVKINAIIVEFEDKLRYRKSPEVAAPHAISIEEFAAISRYAKERHIEISPLVQGLGHASFILKHEEHKDLRDDPESDWAFDPLNPAVYDLQFSLYEDAMASTPYGKYLHVGGDEVGELGKSERARQSGMEPFELQMYWLNKVSDFARRHNRIPIFWDDMLFKLANLYRTTYDPSLPEDEVAALWKENQSLLEKRLPLFPKECVYMRWNYDDPLLPGNRKAIDWYKSHGLKVMAATTAQPYWSMFPQTKLKFDPVREFCQLTAEKNLEGILCTIWDDTSPHLETVVRGVHYFALFGWNKENMEREEANAIFRQRFYGAALAKPSFDFQDLLEGTAPFWETAFLERGGRDTYPEEGDYALISLPEPENRGAWSEAHKSRLAKADSAMKLHAEIGDQIAQAKALARRNRYALSLFEVINELQRYSVSLLQLLERYDQATHEQKNETRGLITKHVAGFEDLRARFEERYAKTRMLGNPDGYILDSNFHHHLANGSNTSDWMFIYEIAFNKKVNDWLSEQ